MGKLIFVSRRQANGGDYRQYRHATYGLIGFTTFDLEPGMIWLEFLDRLAKQQNTWRVEPKPVRKPRAKSR